MVSKVLVQLFPGVRVYLCSLRFVLWGSCVLVFSKVRVFSKVCVLLFSGVRVYLWSLRFVYNCSLGFVCTCLLYKVRV